MSEMIERVALAISGSDALTNVLAIHRSRARLAIAAMREPTKAMIDEAMIQPHPSVQESGGLIEHGRAAIRIDYQAMIDEALK